MLIFLASVSLLILMLLGFNFKAKFWEAIYGNPDCKENRAAVTLDTRFSYAYAVPSMPHNFIQMEIVFYTYWHASIENKIKNVKRSSNE